MNVLITGGCGFIGSAIAEYLIKNTNYQIVIVDKLTYASKGFKRVEHLPKDRVKIFTWDLINPISEGLTHEFGDINLILHLAAESHVDDSIESPVSFIHNNVMSTCQILEYARTLKNLKLINCFSTDEVFGSAPENREYSEEDRHNPRNPYSASKAAAEMICLSYVNTYDLPIITSNCMNVYGNRQHVQKFIPLVIKKLLNNETVYIHSYPDCKKAGTRFYIHTDNVARAVLFLINHGTNGECYNIKGEEEIDNLDLAQRIAKIMDKELKYEMVDFHGGRPGHDLRYSLDGTKMEKLGWKFNSNFDENLKKVVKYTLDNQEWLEE